jgi:hypothetical protein
MEANETRARQLAPDIVRLINQCIGNPLTCAYYDGVAKVRRPTKYDPRWAVAITIGGADYIVFSANAERGDDGEYSMTNCTVFRDGRWIDHLRATANPTRLKYIERLAKEEKERQRLAVLAWEPIDDAAVFPRTIKDGVYVGNSGERNTPHPGSGFFL